jgi:hypothetical protein
MDDHCLKHSASRSSELTKDPKRCFPSKGNWKGSAFLCTEAISTTGRHVVGGTAKLIASILAVHMHQYHSLQLPDETKLVALLLH